MKTVLSIVSTLTLLAAPVAMAATYTDATGDNYGGPEVDISSVVINNDANNINFQVNLNTAANLTVNDFAHYEFGLQVGGGAGGQTSTAFSGSFSGPTAVNPYGNSVGISSGENFFIATFFNSGQTTGGAQLYSYSSGTGWTQLGVNVPITTVATGTPSVAFTFPLASLGLSAGNTFNFDSWTTFGSPQAAYDALGDSSTPPGIAPFSDGATYDSATTGTLSIYTIQGAPEPGTCALLGLGALALLPRVLRRKAS